MKDFTRITANKLRVLIQAQTEHRNRVNLYISENKEISDNTEWLRLIRFKERTQSVTLLTEHLPIKEPNIMTLYVESVYAQEMDMVKDFDDLSDYNATDISDKWNLQLK